MKRLTAVLAACLFAPLAAQTNQTTFRVDVNLVQTDVIARNQRDQFVADLRPREFQVFEDGVRQEVAALTLSHGGGVRDLIASAPLPREGIVLPASRPTTDASGRIFVIVL